MDTVIVRMSVAAQKHVVESLGKTTFHNSSESLRRAAEIYGGNYMQGENVGGFYVGGGNKKGSLHVNGGSESGKHSMRRSHVYAHELGHAVDHGGRYSSTKEWKSIWDSELNQVDTGVSDYSRVNPEEGFAEFFRLVLSVDHGQIKTRWPQAYDYMSKMKLIRGGSSQEARLRFMGGKLVVEFADLSSGKWPELVMPELFSRAKYVRYTDGRRAMFDELLDEPEVDFPRFPPAADVSASARRISESCGANKKGGGGFQPGNTCAKGNSGANGFTPVSEFQSKVESLRKKLTEASDAHKAKDFSGQLAAARKLPWGESSKALEKIGTSQRESRASIGKIESQIRELDGKLRIAKIAANPKFQEWFGDSVAIEDGLPIVLYHGTDSPVFEEFNVKSDSDVGVFMSNDRYMAASYTSGHNMEDMTPIEAVDIDDIKNVVWDSDQFEIQYGVKYELDEGGIYPGLFDTKAEALEYAKSEFEWDEDAGESADKSIVPYYKIYDQDGDLAVEGYDPEQVLADFNWSPELRRQDGGKGGGLYSLFARIEYPMEVDAKGANWDSIEIEGEDHEGNPETYTTTTRELSQEAEMMGYDGLIIRNVIDYGGSGYSGGPEDVYVAYDSRQLKSIHNKGGWDRNRSSILEVKTYNTKGRFLKSYSRVLEHGGSSHDQKSHGKRSSGTPATRTPAPKGGNLSPFSDWKPGQDTEFKKQKKGLLGKGDTNKKERFSASFDVAGTKYTSTVAPVSKQNAATFFGPNSNYDVKHFAFTDDAGSFAVTGRGQAMQVMRKATQQFASSLKQFKPDAMLFMAKEKSRRSLYRFLVKRAAKIFPGYKGVQFSGGSDYVTYAVVRSDVKVGKNATVFETFNSRVIHRDELFDDAFWTELEASLGSGKAYEHGNHNQKQHGNWSKGGGRWSDWVGSSSNVNWHKDESRIESEFTTKSGSKFAVYGEYSDMDIPFSHNFDTKDILS